MTQRLRYPTGSYFDDPAANLDRSQNNEALADALTKLEITRFYEWINRGDARQRGLRSDLVSLCICPQLLPCKYPSAPWCAREHGVTRMVPCHTLRQSASDKEAALDDLRA